MNFEMTASQTHFAQSLARFLARHNDFSQRSADIANGTGDRRVWLLAHEHLSLPALMVPAAQGGHDGGAVEAAIVMEALGRRLAFDAFAEHYIVAPQMLRRLGVDDVLGEVAQGRARVALGFNEAGFSTTQATPIARRSGSHYYVDGRVNMVVGGGDASHLLLRAQLDEEPALFLIPVDSVGLTHTVYALIDGRAACDFSLSAVEVAAPLSTGEGATATLRSAHNQGVAVACAEALGVLRETLELTIAHVSTRRQFGAPLGSFQAIQHRIADMALAVEKADAMTMRLRLELPQTDDAAIFAAAKVVVNEALRFVGQSAVQLHGAMGTVDEAPVSHYFRRATVLEGKFGSTAANLGAYAKAFAQTHERSAHAEA